MRSPASQLLDLRRPHFASLRHLVLALRLRAPLHLFRRSQSLPLTDQQPHLASLRFRQFHLPLPQPLRPHRQHLPLNQKSSRRARAQALQASSRRFHHSAFLFHMHLRPRRCRRLRRHCRSLRHMQRRLLFRPGRAQVARPQQALPQRLLPALHRSSSSARSLLLFPQSRPRRWHHLSRANLTRLPQHQQQPRHTRPQSAQSLRRICLRQSLATSTSSPDTPGSVESARPQILAQAAHPRVPRHLPAVAIRRELLQATLVVPQAAPLLESPVSPLRASCSLSLVPRAISRVRRSEPLGLEPGETRCRPMTRH